MFVVENAQSRLEEITFLVSEFVDMAGQGPFRPPLSIDPPRLALRPETEAEVIIRLPLLAELYPRQALWATVTVRGQDLELVLHALADEATEEAAVPPAANRLPTPAAPPPVLSGRPRRTSRSAAERTAASRGRKPRSEAAAGGTAVAEAGDADR